MDRELGFAELDLGLKTLLRTAASVPSWEYAVLLAIFAAILVYRVLEFHIVGDLLNGWRGDFVALYYSHTSRISAELLTKCETLKQRYSPTFWLCSPHLQTLFLHFFGMSPKVDYNRELYITPDGGTIALDWVVRLKSTEDRIGEDGRHNPELDETPTVIVIPGLTSDSNNHYVKHVSGRLADKGWRVLVANHRGLGGVSITSDQFYNAGWTEDLRRIVLYVNQKYPKAPLIAVGTSIGANILVKYLGEEGNRTPLCGAVAICCPWDLVLCDRFISRRWVQALYNKALTTGLRDYARLHQSALARMMDWDLLSQSRSVRDFDNHCTRVVGKYETVDTYYRRCSSSQFVESIAVPLLCVSAEDDPICTKEAIPYDECRVNPNVILAVTKHGGHLGYFEGLTAKTIWYVRATAEFSSVLLSSSHMHQQNNAPAPLDTKEKASIDQGPFLAVSEDFTVAPQDSGCNGNVVNRTHGMQGQPSGFKPKAQREEIGLTIHEGPHLNTDRSPSLGSKRYADDGSYVVVTEDYGGPLYKAVNEEFGMGPGANNRVKGDPGMVAALGTHSNFEDLPLAGQPVVQLQLRSVSELVLLQSVLSQVLDQIQLKLSIVEESHGDQVSAMQQPSHLSRATQVQTLEPRSISSVVSEHGEAVKNLLAVNQDLDIKTVAKLLEKRKDSSHWKEQNLPGQFGPVNKDLARLASQNRRTLWILTYLAIVTTFPFLGSALLVRTRGKILQVLNRQWLKYSP